MKKTDKEKQNSKKVVRSFKMGTKESLEKMQQKLNWTEEEFRKHMTRTSARKPY